MAAAAALFAACSASAQDLAVEYRNTVSLPAQAIDQSGVAFTVTGLSGLSYAGADRWWACMDNSNKLVELAVTFTPQGSMLTATIVRGFSLPTSADTEDIVVAGSLAWLADESPLLRQVDLTTGALSRSMSLPAPFAQVRPNFGLESLTLAPKGVYWTANEEALAVDGPLSTPSAGTLVRLVRLMSSGPDLMATSQYAYLTAPMHGPNTSQARSGLSALVALPSGRVLSLERSFAFNLASLFQSRIYELDFAAATQVQGLASLVDPFPVPPVVPVSKRLLHQSFHANLEGLALGPALVDGGRQLLGIVDDGDPLSVNQLVAFRLTGPIDPPCPADIDGDADVDSDDTVAFFARWDAGLPEGDLDADGDVDSDDIIAFFAAFESGC
ncbi:MAG: esterase-like activity of phytase family protein [bacterium]|nr:esterase-like activity of phytase family protein [bacterium]